MHDTALVFAQTVLSPAAVRGARVLEVGSYNVNGSVRPWVMRWEPESYTGVDREPQAGFVDWIVPAERLADHYGPRRFDVVICLEMLEHAEHWQAAVFAMKQVLRVGGLMVLTCRGPGFPRHCFPDDYWRFTPADIETAFADFDTEVLIEDPEPGVLFAGRRLSRVATYPVNAVAPAPNH